MKHAEKKTYTELKYICEFCDYETISEINLTKHEKDVHLRTKAKTTSNRAESNLNKQEANKSDQV